MPARSRPHRLRAAVAVSLLLAAPTIGRAGPGAATAGVTCTQDWRPASTPAYLAPDGTPTSPPAPLPPPPAPQYRAHHVFCGGHYVNTVWRAPTDGPNEAAMAAYCVVTGARYPSVHPAANPTTGLTGLASWFWAVPDASPVHMLPGNGPGVDIELRIDTVRWRFGDGTVATVRGLGVPYPEPSPVTHVFEQTGTVRVEARVALIGRLRGEELDAEFPGAHTVLLAHTVVQVRSLLHAD
ncbi:MAG: hypothetical protein ACKOA9_07950 [Actinomycetota bacterium]